MGLDPAGSLEVRVQVANVQCAWNNASTRVQRAAEIEAELDTKEALGQFRVACNEGGIREDNGSPGGEGDSGEGIYREEASRIGGRRA